MKTEILDFRFWILDSNKGGLRWATAILILLLCAGLPEAQAALSKSSPTGEEVWRINCGATAADYADPAGNTWVKDEDFYSIYRWGYINGNTASTTSNITNTSTPEIYKSSRWGGTNLSYKVEVPNGTYRVRLMFAETYWNQAGKRVFNVALEGNTLWSFVDIWAWAGNAMNKAMDLTADVTVTDGVLDVTFPVVQMDNACISGIEVKVLTLADDAFLDFVQKKMFWFYWNEADVQTGLVKWGENNFAQGYGNTSSIATDGFALSIYTIAASRGWITRQQAYDRVMKMLNTFETVIQNVHGFWWHFVYTATGAREGTTEISTVDSALFIMGALQAGEFFRSDHPDVASKADLLYRRMEWSWFLNVNAGDPYLNRFVNMGWKPEYQPGSPHGYVIASGRPEGGYFVNDWWNRYSESVFVNFLALGSPTYSAGPAAWTDMGKPWVDDFGYHYVNEPPLFTHQFHHLYYDMRNRHDGKVDYVDNTRKATQVNRLTCENDSRYEPKRWGLSGSNGPTGYQAYGAGTGGFHDGTVDPAAPAATMNITPTESIQATRFMFFQYKHHIWGQYGFSDAFNVSADWKDWLFDGLSAGALVIGIENYRTGMVRNEFMKNPYLATAYAQAGIKTFGQSALYNASTGSDAPNAFDNNMTTRWGSAFADPQWLEVDYGAGRTFNKVTINWEAAYGKDYKIQASWDANTWWDVATVVNGNGATDILTFPMNTARYWRMYGTKRGTAWGYSIWEMKFENTVNLALNKPATSSSNENSGVTAPKAFDGSFTTRWASLWSDPQWVRVDLGSNQNVSRVILHWEYAYGKDYKIQTSTDNINWTDRFTAVNGDGGVDECPFTAVSARYIRMYGTARGTGFGYSLWEMQVQ